jgi:hypothetical protein
MPQVPGAFAASLFAPVGLVSNMLVFTIKEADQMVIQTNAAAFQDALSTQLKLKLATLARVGRGLKGLTTWSIAVAFVLTAGASVSPNPSMASSLGLTNPAAEHCVSEGGFYGMRNDDNGKRGVCILANGDEVDAWDFLRDKAERDREPNQVGIANPAVSFCILNQGEYDLKTSICSLPDGTKVNAWEFYREAHAASNQIANPAATYCIEIGGSYEIRDGEVGQFGVCRLPDGTEVDAWTLYREHN